VGLRNGDEEDEVNDEEDHALQVDRDNLAGKRGNHEEQAADEEDLDGGDGEVNLRHHGKIDGTDAGVVCPGREAAGDLTNGQPDENQEGSDK